jgi:apolipoprotein N-acyltransferase
MKKNRTVLLLGLAALFVLLMSVPFLVEGCGWMALVGFVPLLCMERVADQLALKHFWWWHYGTFAAWNAVTTFWVCNATVGGGIFAILANALQMSLVFGLFRWVKRRMKGRGGALPYLFLAAAWIAWEKYYLTVAEISWPWLVLGNAFAGTSSLVQWYEFTGTLGGSLWIWAVSLSVFGLLVAFSDGRFSSRWNAKARFAAIGGTVLVLLGPIVCSLVLYHGYEEVSEGVVPVVIAQPDFDPYHKFGGMTQDEQNAVLLDQFARGLKDMEKENPGDSSSVLLLAPETFTSDILCNDVPSSRTFRRFVSFLREHPRTEILFGASSWTRFDEVTRPSANARRLGDGGWYETHNSALIVDSAGRYGLYQKSKLVPGVEMLPYVKVLGPIDDKLLGGVAGRCVGQAQVSNLVFHADGPVPIGCAVCYESVYGEHCAKYVRAGAQLLTVITNDAWWGDTPGYRQHLDYARLRAIETRRDIARCANTGISAFIDQRGRILSRTAWWEPAILRGAVNLSSRETFFVRNGDIVGRLCVFLFALLFAAALIRRK